MKNHRIKEEMASLRLILGRAIARLMLLEDLIELPDFVDPTMKELQRVPMSEIAKFLLKIRKRKGRGR